MKALKICALLVAAPFAPFLFAIAGHVLTFTVGPFVLGCMAYGLFMFFRYRIKHGKWYRAPGPSRPNLSILTVGEYQDVIRKAKKSRGLITKMEDFH